MIISIGVVLLITASGTVATYLYDARTAFAARLCAGLCIGMALLGLLGFIFASFFGLNAPSMAMLMLTMAAPLLVLMNRQRREQFVEDTSSTVSAVRQALLHPTRIRYGYPIFYLLVAVVLWRCFQRAMLELPDGIYTGLQNNYGDLPFHLSVITSFVYGHNFLPEDPTYAGVFFTYPFLTDFIAALFVYFGASLRHAMFLENFVIGLAFVGLVHDWALKMLEDRFAAIITPLLVFLNGGLGWIFLWTYYSSDQPFGEFLASLPRSFTIIPETTWRWGNTMSTLLIPQRGFLLGLPLAVIVFTEWWRSGQVEIEAKPKGKKTKAKDFDALEGARANTSMFALTPSVKRMIGAGTVAGLIPLVHAHSFVAIMMVGAGIALLERRWRDWFFFFLSASIIALPQLWWSTHNSAVHVSSFFEIHYGWDHGTENIVWFWLRNSGLFIPLTIAALVWGGKERLVSVRLLKFFLPFLLCFIVPNVIKLAPWVWDNIKVLFYWWLGSAPLVALLLSRLWRRGFQQRVLAGVLFFSLTAAGALDIATIMFRSYKLGVFDSSGLAFAETIKQVAPPRSLVLHAPVHNHPVFLTGRRSLMGYPGHIWTHGLEFGPRSGEIKRIYGGAPDAQFLLMKYGISFVVVSPLERSQMIVNENFFNRFKIAGESGAYRLYQVGQ